MSRGSIAFTPLSLAACLYLMLRVMTESKPTGDSSLSSQISFRLCFFPVPVFLARRGGSCLPARGKRFSVPLCSDAPALAGAQGSAWGARALHPGGVPGSRRDGEGCLGTGCVGSGVQDPIPWEGASVLPGQPPAPAVGREPPPHVEPPFGQSSLFP